QELLIVNSDVDRHRRPGRAATAARPGPSPADGVARSYICDELLPAGGTHTPGRAIEARRWLWVPALARFKLARPERPRATAPAARRRSAMLAGLKKTRRLAMDAVTPKTNEAAAHSHIVRPAEMEWQKTRFPGCEAKTLLFDRASGLVTALMRFAPGAVLPDHEHVKIEQTYVLEG